MRFSCMKIGPLSLEKISRRSSGHHRWEPSHPRQRASRVHCHSGRKVFTRRLQAKRNSSSIKASRQKSAQTNLLSLFKRSSRQQNHKFFHTARHKAQSTLKKKNTQEHGKDIKNSACNGPEGQSSQDSSAMCNAGNPGQFEGLLIPPNPDKVSMKKKRRREE